MFFSVDILADKVYNFIRSASAFDHDDEEQIQRIFFITEIQMGAFLVCDAPPASFGVVGEMEIRSRVKLYELIRDGLLEYE